MKWFQKLFGGPPASEITDDEFDRALAADKQSDLAPTRTSGDLPRSEARGSTLPQPGSAVGASTEPTAKVGPAFNGDTTTPANDGPTGAGGTTNPSTPGGVSLGGKNAEELCKITANMPEDEIRARLSFLYRRHNRAAASLDPRLRAEAELMLEAIVEVREKRLP